MKGELSRHVLLSGMAMALLLSLPSLTFAQATSETSAAQSPATESSATESPATESPANESQARVHFTAGRQYFDVGEYEGALREFERAHELSQRPALLYNIGLCHERLAQYSAAADAYEGYVDSGSAGDDSEMLSARVRALRERASRSDAAGGSDDASQAAGGGDPGLMVGAIATLGGAAVGAVVAAVLGGLALGEQSELEACRPNCALGADDTMRALAAGADVAMGVTVAAGAVGAVMLALALSANEETDVAAAPWVTEDSAGLVFGGMW